LIFYSGKIENYVNYKVLKLYFIAILLKKFTKFKNILDILNK